MQDSITLPRGLALPKGAPMIYWTPGESDYDARPYDNHSIDRRPTVTVDWLADARTSLATRANGDPIAMLDLAMRDLRVRFDARNARGVA